MTNFIDELKAKMSASSGVVFISEEDETRLETQCHQAAVQEGYNCFRWTYTDGLVPVSRNVVEDLKTRGIDLDQQLASWATMVDPAKLLQEVKNWAWGPSVVICFDIFTMANRLPTLPIVMRLIKDITELQQTVQAQDPSRPDAGVCQLVLCDGEMPQLETPLQRMRLELPDRQELTSILDSILGAVKNEKVVNQARANQDRILNALAGLPAYQVGNAINESLVRTGAVDASLLKEYKKELVSAKGLTWIECDDQGFDSIGGLGPLKTWLKKRAAVMMDDELRAEYGVGTPKGVICAGIPGCGKSLGAKATASSLGVPLLAVNISATKSKWQGASGENFANLISTVESIPCVLLIDEAEKQLGGTTATDTDGGTGSRMLSELLVWMQENTAKVLVYFTSNNPSALPPELLRAGRVSGQFWFDSPTKNERVSIINVMMTQFPKAVNVDRNVVLQASDSVTGAELHSCFEEASITAMAERRDVTTDDVVAALGSVSKVKDTFTMSPEMEAWKKAAQRANDPEDTREANAPTQKVRRIGRVR